MNGRTGRKQIGPRRLLRSLVHQSNHPALTTVGSGESFIGGRKVSLLCDRYQIFLYNADIPVKVRGIVAKYR